MLKNVKIIVLTKYKIYVFCLQFKFFILIFYSFINRKIYNIKAIIFCLGSSVSYSIIFCFHMEYV